MSISIDEFKKKLAGDKLLNELIEKRAQIAKEWLASLDQRRWRLLAVQSKLFKLLRRIKAKIKTNQEKVAGCRMAQTAKPLEVKRMDRRIVIRRGNLRRMVTRARAVEAQMQAIKDWKEHERKIYGRDPRSVGAMAEVKSLLRAGPGGNPPVPGPGQPNPNGGGNGT